MPGTVATAEHEVIPVRIPKDAVPLRDSPEYAENRRKQLETQVLEKQAKHLDQATATNAAREKEARMNVLVKWVGLALLAGAVFLMAQCASVTADGLRALGQTLQAAGY